MNRYVERSLQIAHRVSELSPRLEDTVRQLMPRMGSVRTRAQVRQEAWMKRRQEQWISLVTSLSTYREKATGWLSTWIEIEGIIEKPTFEVRPSGVNGWKIVERGSAASALKHFSKKDDAILEAKRLAQNRRGELSVYTRKNSVQETHSFA